MNKTLILLAAGVSVAIAGCGTTQAAKSMSSPASKTRHSSSMSASQSHTTRATVEEISSNKTAQVIEAGQSATFVLKATTSGQRPAAGQPVTFYIGPMVPLGHGVTNWYKSGTPQAAGFIKSYSKVTNSQGQAMITLSPQPTKHMEMVAVKIGNFNTFNSSAMTGAGLLDAWWTTPSTSPMAPVGDYVQVSPFAQAAKAGQKQVLTITAMSPNGPISGASVDVIPKGSLSSSSSSMSSSSGMNGSMSSQGGKILKTNSSGRVTYTVTASAQSMASLPVRIVVSNHMERVAGGMNADIMTH